VYLYSTTTFSVKGRRSSERIKVCCIFGMPNVPNQPDMICCSNCENWYHDGIFLQSPYQKKLGVSMCIGVVQDVLASVTMHR